MNYMDNPKLTQVYYWDDHEIILMDKEDYQYMAIDIKSFEIELEGCGAFNGDHRAVLEMFGGVWQDFVKELPDDTLWLVNYLFTLDPDKFEQHFKRIP